VDAVIIDVGKHVGEPGLRVYVVEPCATTFPSEQIVNVRKQSGRTIAAGQTVKASERITVNFTLWPIQ
jgi:hypothetical protein